MTRKYKDIPYYPDKGCEFADSCLNCPLPKCVLDELIVGTKRARKKNRNEEIWQRFKDGENISALAKAFGVSQRTIRRVVNNG